MPHSSRRDFIQSNDACCVSFDLPVRTGPQEMRIVLDGSTVPKSLNHPFAPGRVGSMSVFTAIGTTGTPDRSASLVPMEPQLLRENTGWRVPCA